MAFKGIEKFKENKKQDFMHYIKPWVIQRKNEGNPIGIEEYNTLYINGYERKYLFPLFDDNVLIHLIEYSLGQDGNQELWEYNLPRHYTDAVLRQYLPELIRRFKKQK